MPYLFTIDFSGFVELADEMMIYDVLSKLFEYASSSGVKIENVRFELQREEDEEEVEG